MKNNFNSLKTKATLFVVCPFCHLESKLRKEFGKNTFFITSPAGISNFNSEEIEAINQIIFSQKIKSIYVINDLSCHFLEEALLDKKPFGLNCESKLRDLVINLNTIKRQSLEYRKRKLALLNIQVQMDYLRQTLFSPSEFISAGIKIDGFITNKNTQGLQLINS